MVLDHTKMMKQLEQFCRMAYSGLKTSKRHFLKVSPVFVRTERHEEDPRFSSVSKIDGKQTDGSSTLIHP